MESNTQSVGVAYRSREGYAGVCLVQLAGGLLMLARALDWVAN